MPQSRRTPRVRRDFFMAGIIGSRTASFPADFNGDGTVNGIDLDSLLESWGPCG